MRPPASPLQGGSAPKLSVASLDQMTSLNPNDLITKLKYLFSAYSTHATAPNCPEARLFLAANASLACAPADDSPAALPHGPHSPQRSSWVSLE